MMLDKKAISAFKRKFELHVGLVMEQDRATKSAAMVQAYHEGVEGVAKRLSIPLPLFEEPVPPAAKK